MLKDVQTVFGFMDMSLRIASCCLTESCLMCGGSMWVPLLLMCTSFIRGLCAQRRSWLMVARSEPEGFICADKSEPYQSSLRRPLWHLLMPAWQSWEECRVSYMSSLLSSPSTFRPLKTRQKETFGLEYPLMYRAEGCWCQNHLYLPFLKVFDTKW